MPALEGRQAEGGDIGEGAGDVIVEVEVEGSHGVRREEALKDGEMGADGVKGALEVNVRRTRQIYLICMIYNLEGWIVVSFLLPRPNMRSCEGSRGETEVISLQGLAEEDE